MTDAAPLNSILHVTTDKRVAKPGCAATICLMTLALVASGPSFSQEARARSEWKGVSRTASDPLKVSLSIMDRITKRKDVKGHLKDMACGCQIDARQGRVGQPFECRPVIEAATEDASVLKAVRIVGEEELAATMACFKQGISACRKDPAYRSALADPHLVFVVPAPVADALDGYKLGPIEKPVAPVAGCDVVVDRGKGTYALDQRWHGFVARALMYASEHYNVRTRLLPGELKRISEQHPPTPQERLMSMEGKPLGIPQEMTDAAVGN
jgi:endonuclease I